MTPSAIIVGILAYFYKKYKDLDSISNVLYFLRPAIISMILIAGVDILMTALFDTRAIALMNLDYKMLVLFGLILILMIKKDIDPIKLMLASGAIYLLISLI